MEDLHVISYQWGSHRCYLGTMKYEDVPKYINMSPDQSMNRDIKWNRVDDIIDYISTYLAGSFFPPVILNSGTKIKCNLFENSQHAILRVNTQGLRIIDGQHRINAICKIFSEDQYRDVKNNIKNLEISFLLIENLESETHRNLFNLINENSTNVDKTVSKRFSTDLENLIGLKYVAENTKANNEQIKSNITNSNTLLWTRDLIEWELKNSSKKIVYKHMTDCNKLIIDFLAKTYKAEIEEDIKFPYYDNDQYFNIFKVFWDKIFNHVNQINDMNKAFWVKLIALMAITTFLCKEIESTSTSFGDIDRKISEVLDKYLLDDLIIEYSGSTANNSKTYDVILNLLKFNIKFNEEITVHSQAAIEEDIRKVINKFVCSTYRDNNYIDLSDANYPEIKGFIVRVLENKDAIISKIHEIDKLKSITNFDQINAVIA